MAWCSLTSILASTLLLLLFLLAAIVAPSATPGTTPGDAQRGSVARASPRWFVVEGHELEFRSSWLRYYVVVALLHRNRNDDDGHGELCLSSILLDGEVARRALIQTVGLCAFHRTLQILLNSKLY